MKGKVLLLLEPFASIPFQGTNAWKKKKKKKKIHSTEQSTESEWTKKNKKKPKSNCKLNPRWIRLIKFWVCRRMCNSSNSFFSLHSFPSSISILHRHSLPSSSVACIPSSGFSLINWILYSYCILFLWDRCAFRVFNRTNTIFSALCSLHEWTNWKMDDSRCSIRCDPMVMRNGTGRDKKEKKKSYLVCRLSQHCNAMPHHWL